MSNRNRIAHHDNEDNDVKIMLVFSVVMFAIVCAIVYTPKLFC